MTLFTAFHCLLFVCVLQVSTSASLDRKPSHFAPDGYDKDMLESVLKEVINDEISKMKQASNSRRNTNKEVREMDRQYPVDEKPFRESYPEPPRRRPETIQIEELSELLGYNNQDSDRKHREEKMRDERAREDRQRLDRMRQKIEQETMNQERRREERLREERLRDEKIKLDRMRLEQLRQSIVEEKIREEKQRDEKRKQKEEEESMKEAMNFRSLSSQMDDKWLAESSELMGTTEHLMKPPPMPMGGMSFGPKPMSMMSPFGGMSSMSSMGSFPMPSFSMSGSSPFGPSPYGPKFGGFSSFGPSPFSSPMSSSFGPPPPSFSPMGSMGSYSSASSLSPVSMSMGSPLGSSMNSPMSSSMSSPMGSSSSPLSSSSLSSAMAAMYPSLYPNQNQNERSAPGQNGQDGQDTKSKVGKKVKSMLMDFAVSSILDVGMLNIMGNILGKVNSDPGTA